MKNADFFCRKVQALRNVDVSLAELAILRLMMKMLDVFALFNAKIGEIRLHIK